MFKSAKGASSQEEELDDEDEFMIKKENSPVPKGNAISCYKSLCVDMVAVLSLYLLYSSFAWRLELSIVMGLNVRYCII